MEFTLDVSDIEEEYKKFIEDLSNDEKNKDDLKYFLVKDENGNPLTPSLFIQLITTLCDKQLFKNNKQIKPYKDDIS